MLILMLTILVVTFVGTITWKHVYYRWFVETKYFNKWTKLNEKIDILRILSISACIVCLGLYIGLRWSLGLKNIIDYNLLAPKQPASEFRSANISIVFMLDLCSFVGFWILIVKIFDNKNKYILKPLAYMSALGGYATLLFTCTETYLFETGKYTAENYVERPWDAYYFFFSAKTIGIGDSDEPLMFLMHFWMVCIGVHTIVWEPSVTVKDIIKILAFVILYAIYIFAVSRGLDIQTHVTAMVKGDFVSMPDEYYTREIDGRHPMKYLGHPSYQVFLDIYYGGNHSPDLWGAGSALAWVSFTVIVLLIIALKNIVYSLTTNNAVVIDTISYDKAFK